MQNHVSIIKYWRAIEVFEPQQIPKLSPNSKDEPVINADSDDFLLWKNQKLNFAYQSNLKDRMVVRHQIYCGVFTVRRLKELFETVFGSEDESNFDGRDNGESAVFSFTVNEKGQPLIETFSLASCAWALGKTLTSGHQATNWLDGFDQVVIDFAKKFAGRMAQLARLQTNKSETMTENEVQNGNRNNAVKALTGETSSENGESELLPILSFDDLSSETRLICENLGVTELLESVQIRVKSQKIWLKESAPEQSDFLNSFFYRDLEVIANEVGMGNYGLGLREYLTSNNDLNQTNRVDLRQSVAALFQQTSPALFPRGRWAANVQHPLVFSQQLAVNSMWQKLANNAGLFSVNGPPGTGKTTLLRDLIAAVIVERAEQLAKFKNPKQAFYGAQIHWKSLKDYDHRISPLKNELKGFGIVIASSNNGAVENISLELPAKKAIHEDWHEECEYFSNVALNLLRNPKTAVEEKEEKEELAWGLVAARLGNAQNRSDFVDKFWFDKNDNSFKLILDAAEFQPQASQDAWETAVREFRVALADEQKLRAKKLEIYQHFFELSETINGLNELRKQKEAISAKLSKIEIRLQEKENEKENFGSRQLEVERQKQSHDETRPSWLSNLFSLWRKLPRWKAENNKLQKELSEARDQVFELGNEVQRTKIEKQRIVEEINKIDSLVRSLSARRLTLDLLLKKVQVNLGNNYPNISKWQQKEFEEDRELSSPWSDEHWTAARTKVFIKALTLHNVFIHINALTIKRNLTAFIDLLKGRIHSTSISAGAADVWSTFFLVVPVVSTTFASFDKLFSHLQREEIGWLLIDEAGQAVPQAAVGALWRSRRAVVVGDPLQLEPISILPSKMQKALGRKFGVGDTWLPGSTSVQELADRVNVLGTKMKVKDKSIWVGSPLRVHRRCQEPMFSIANKIAYDGLMVFGTELNNRIELAQSDWIDVKSDVSQGHWIPAEGVEAEDTIRELREAGVKPKDIYLISPFLQAARELWRLGAKYGIKNAGTVHTTQGKEANVVILVLGGDPAKPGAKAWAASKPNLLNVAVSRAKQRIYIIGNKDLWRKQPYFKTAIDEIENYQKFI